MFAVRSVVYAEAQARIRARLGSMPDAAAWRRLSSATDLEQLIGELRTEGLSRWVAGLPRRPDIATIEARLFDAIRNHTAELAGWLPSSHRRLRRWLLTATGILLLHRVLADPAPVLPDNADIDLRHAAGMPPELRAAALAATPFGPYAASPSALHSWLSEFPARLPWMSRSEAAAIARIVRLVRGYAARLRALRQAARDDPAFADDHAQWRLQWDLGARARTLSAGNPFHAGLILIYGILEWLDFERCRALLTAQACRWPAPDVTGGTR